MAKECEACGGSTVCRKCKGSGKKGSWITSKCDRCAGSGDCNACGGTGKR